MRYATASPVRRAIVSAMSLAIAATVLFGAPSQASAITQNDVLKRGKSWVDKKVPYSQSRYHNGYRQDCSGFVSMAWKLNTSYTTRSIHTKARRIGTKSLRAGDAVLRPGHIVLFVSWKDKKRGTFYAYEQPSSGKTARKSVQTLRGGSVGYRLKGIKDNPRPAPKVKKTPPAEKLKRVLEPVVPPASMPASAEPVSAATARVWALR